MSEEKTISYFYNKDTKTYTISDKEMKKINRRLKERFTLKQENKQLQNNWNELKKIIEQDIRKCEELIEMCPKELRNTIIGTRSYEEIIGHNKYILSKMQELEEGKNES